MKKTIITAFLLIFLLGFSSATNGCNLQDPDCADGLVDNCDVRGDLVIPNGDYKLTYGIDVCYPNAIIDFSNGSLIGTYPRVDYSVGIFSEGYDIDLRNGYIENFTTNIYTIDSNVKIFKFNSSYGENPAYLSGSYSVNIQNSSFDKSTDYALAIYGNGNLEEEQTLGRFIIENNFIGNSMNNCVDLEGLPKLKTSIKFNIIGSCDELIRNSDSEKLDIMDNYFSNARFGVTMYGSDYNEIYGNYFENVSEPFFEYDGSRGNNYNDSNRGNFYDNLESLSSPRKRTALSFVFPTLFYKVGGDYDGVDYKPRQIIEDVDNLELKRNDIKELLENLELENRDQRISTKIIEFLDEVDFNNPTKEDINNLKKAYTKSLRLQNEYNYYLQNEITSLIRQVAKDKLESSVVEEEIYEKAKQEFDDGEELYYKGFNNRAVANYKKSFVILDRF